MLPFCVRFTFCSVRDRVCASVCSTSQMINAGNGYDKQTESSQSCSRRGRRWHQGARQCITADHDGITFISASWRLQAKPCGATSLCAASITLKRGGMNFLSELPRFLPDPCLSREPKWICLRFFTFLPLTSDSIHT